MTAIPFVKDISFVYGRPDRLSPLIRRVICENPGPFTYTGSGTYIVGRDEGPLAVIDPGPDNQAHLEALLAAIGGARVSHVLITHTHKDHCGGARAFAARAKAPIWGARAHPVGDKAQDAPALEEGADLEFRPDRVLKDGETVSGDGWTIDAVATPGHLSNHLCFALLEEKVLFTGDHVMGWSTSVVSPPDGDMAAYMNSLALLIDRDDLIYHSAHGAPIENPQRLVLGMMGHRKQREGQILRLVEQGIGAITDMVPHMYKGIDQRLWPAAGRSVLAHLIDLRDRGRVAELDGRWLKL